MLSILYKRKKRFPILQLVIILGITLCAAPADGQKLRHGGGGGRSVSRPTTRNVPARNTSARPATRSRGSINGGSQKMPNRSNSSNSSIRNKNSNNNINRGSGNRVNVDNSKRNVNINVNNSRNVNINNRRTVVRPAVRPYARPPYRYGGRSFYCYHPYFYHPFHPFYWGPVWHPWGFFVATLATTAIIVSIENQQYHYDQGVYYVKSDNGYTVVEAPVGATITTLPEKSETVIVNETTNNYYYGGTYYEKSDKGYTVVPPTAGTTVEHLPEGAEEVKVGDQTYVKYGDTYYMPVQKDGKDMYEVAEVKEEEK